jgi:hypothetical protein
MACFGILLCLVHISIVFADFNSPGIHLPIFRRGGRFSHHAPANLTYLSQVLADIEARYARSYRAVEGNQLVRKWRKNEELDENDPQLVAVAGQRGRW